MRIRSVRARAFGGLPDHELTFAEGLTVVTGANEVGKSTWHAAITALVCGMRRGRGARRKEDQRFVDRHRPWGREDFVVSGVIELADGRVVELHHDLAGLVDCTATDADLGTDVSGEILAEGTPDAARFVGLTRESFRAVASVSQGQVLAVVEDAAALQEELHRAAATAGTDETAEAAVQIIDEVLRDEVGFDRANSTRPLRRAKEALEAAELAEQEVRRRHEAWQDEIVAITESTAHLARAERSLRLAEAVASRDTAVAAAGRLAEVEELLERTVVADELDPGRHAGGDDESNTAVDRAAAALDDHIADLAAHERLRPEPAEPAVSGGVDAARVDSLLRRLTVTAPPHRDAERRELARLEAESSHGRPRSAVVPLMGTAIAVIGSLIALLGHTAPGTGVFAVGVVVVVAGLVVGRRGAVTNPEAGRIAVLRGLIEVADEDRLRHERERAAVVDELRAADLPTTPEALTAELRRRRDALELDRRVEVWRTERTELRRLCLDAAEHLADALRAAGAEVPGGPITDDHDIRRIVGIHRARREEEGDRLLARRETRARLEALLAGATVDELRDRAAALDDRARASETGFDDEELTSWNWDGDPGDHLDRLRRNLAAVRDEHTRRTAAHEARSAEVPSVGEAVEATAAARAELDRVERLAGDLTRTRAFLESAVTEVNRDIAPQLADAIRGDVAAVTAGRYDDVRIDPADLTVTVRDPDGRWRPATALSHGTAEQIHLLLRLALADLLVAPGESVPVLLDDVLVQSDRDRSLALLDLFRRRAADRQIILFSQERAVRSWARETLADDPRHAHVELPEPVGRAAI